MSVIQVEDLVLYQLRTSYLNEVADGVGERLFTLNDNLLNSAPFKSAGWRPNPALIKRTHSPPIPTAIASEYFQAPRMAGHALEDEGEEGGLFAGASDAVGPSMALKRRRRREQMEDEDSSDLSDESDDEADQRAAQQIKFAKLPLRNRSGSSPLQSSTLRQTTTLSSPRPAPRRGSQSALETVKERARRDTATSSEVSSENEFDASGFHKQREAARVAAAAAAARAAKLSVKLNTEPTPGVKRQESDLLEEEEDEDSDESTMSSALLESVDSVSILDAVKSPLNASLRNQVVGTPPREFTRRSTIRKSAIPAPLQISVGTLPPPRPVSTIRPLSMVQPKSLLSAALRAKKTKPALPFESFASLSGQGDPNPITLRIYAPFSKRPSQPFEVLIRRTVHQGEGGDRVVTVADLIGLSLWRYNEEKVEPPLPSDKLNVNWWTLRMVEEDGEVDDDFPPLERKKPLISFTTANNKAGRGRSNSKIYDIFALSMASQDEFEENQTVTPEFAQEAGDEAEEEVTPRNTPRPEAQAIAAAPAQPRENPLLNTIYRANVTMFADMPQPAQPSAVPVRGEKRLLRIHIQSSDVAPGQMVTLDVSTDMFLAEVLDLACRKRQLDKANHVLKLLNSGTVVQLDRTVASLGTIMDLDLYRRRFATDGPLVITGSPSSSSPRPLVFADNSSWTKSKRTKLLGTHPLAKEVLKQDELLGALGANSKRYVVWRKQPMRLMSEKAIVIEGEYVHILPVSSGKMGELGDKSTSVHFSNVVGCKVSRKHPTNFKLVVYKSNESKRYDFVANSPEYATEIVQELKKGISPFRDV